LEPGEAHTHSRQQKTLLISTKPCFQNDNLYKNIFHRKDAKSAKKNNL